MIQKGQPANADQERRLLVEEVRALSAGMPSALLAAGLASLVLLGAMWGVSSPAAGLAWLALHLGFIGLRLLDLRHSAPADTLAQARRQWRRLIAGVATTGVTWGSTALVFFAPEDPTRQTVLGLLLVAVAGGGISLHVSSVAATAAFVIPTLAPISLLFLLQSGPAQALGAAGLLFIAVVLIAARRVSHNIVENQTLRLELEARGRELAASQEKLALHFQLTPVGVVEWDQNFRVVGWNAAAERIFGYSKSQALDLHGRDLLFEADVERLEPTMQALLAGTGGDRSVNPNRRRDGSEILCQWFNTPLVTDDGEVIGVTSLVQDITEQQRTETALRDSEHKFRNLVERSLAGVYMIRDGRFFYVNPMLARIFGYRPEDIVGKSVAQLVWPEDRDTVLENIRKRVGGEVDSLRYQFRGIRKNGSPVEVEVLGTRAELDGYPVILGTLLDVTEAVAARNRIEHLANFDALTDLPNRLSISNLGDQLIASSKLDGQSLTCLYIDLDRFKNVNDTLGHDVGDQLLNEAAQRMRGCLRANDTLARMGGDEFTVLLPQADDDSVMAAARRIIRRLSEPFSIGGRLIRVGASIGAARLDADIRDFNELWKRADIAMYRAKRSRGTFSFFDLSQESELTTRVQLENDLDRAIQEGQLSLCYQPRVDLSTLACPSVEALVRWHHPELGPVAPSIFVPIAESTGTIHQLGHWVLSHACEQLHQWRLDGFEFRVAVNLSVIELQRPDIVERIESTLANAGVDPHWLELEVTESAAMEDPEHTVEVVSRLRDLGLAISIDDFGTGYSSLSYLKRIPAHHLKIDRSFLASIGGDDQSATVDADIVRAIIALAHSLGMETIAEGVECPTQQSFLLKNGCHLAQGYYFSHPMTAPELTDWASMRI